MKLCNVFLAYSRDHEHLGGVVNMSFSLMRCITKEELPHNANSF